VFRTGIRSACAAAAAAAVVCVTACGPLQMGAAAIVGTERIPTSTLAADVAALNKVYQANPGLQANVQYKPAQMPQLVLMWLVRFQILDDITRRAGVQVTSADAQRGVAAASLAIKRQTGTSVTPAVFAVFNALPPGLTNQYGRFEASIEKLAVLYTGAKDASSLSAAQQQQFSQRITVEVAAAAKRLNIKINPRFGKLNATQLTIDPAPDTLSRPA
jgi:hypothetical protein